MPISFAVVAAEERQSAHVEKTAQVLLEQHELLLHDQIGLAESHRNARRTSATLLLVLIGIGIFRIESFGSLAASMPWIAWVLVAAISCFFLGAYYLYTEKSLSGLGQRLSAGDHALVVLHLSDQQRGPLTQLPPAHVLYLRTRLTALAYRQLREANSRVRGRLRKSVFFLLLGILLAFVAFSAYLLFGLEAQ